MKKFVLFLAMALSFNITFCAQKNGTGTTSQEGLVKIKITIGNDEITATMDDNAAAKDFISLLPITLSLEDYNGIEKISDIPKKLSTTGTPQGHDPSVGDICLYAPWGNLAIFYKDFGYSNGLVLLGKIDGNVNVFNTTGTLMAKFELME